MSGQSVSNRKRVRATRRFVNRTRTGDSRSAHITYDIACVYALRGKTEEAVKWLRSTADTGMPNYPLFARDPHLDRIRKEPAFIQFMAELKTRWEGYRRDFDDGP
jgi:hypothetical protein